MTGKYKKKYDDVTTIIFTLPTKISTTFIMTNGHDHDEILACTLTITTIMTSATTTTMPLTITMLNKNLVSYNSTNTFVHKKVYIDIYIYI